MTAAALTAELVEDAIALCHPDRHPDRQARATRATQMLLALRAAAEPAKVADSSRVPLWVSVTNLSASGVVTPHPAHLLSIRVDSREEGAAITLYDATRPTNPSTGVLQPNIETRFLHTTHRIGIYAEIRGAMDVTFFFIKQGD